MAEVLLARQSSGSLDRLVVIKSILPHLSDDAELGRMFLAEGRLAARLQHPNIVQILDVGVIDGRPCIVMEHLDGLDVRNLTEAASSRPPIAVEVAVAIGIGAAYGLGYAHRSRGLDGKPLGVV